MTRRKNILKEYRKADLNKRLNLFLECPSLRSRFLEIDQSETAGESLLVASQKEENKSADQSRTLPLNG